MHAKFPFVVLGVLCLASWAVWRARDIERRDRAGWNDSPASDAMPFSHVPGAAPAGELADLCCERAARLPRQLAQPCSAIVRPPFVLAGDLTEAELQAKFADVIRPACDALLARYFRQLPDRAMVILMFTTEAAYREAAEQLFFDRGVSRFGYYKPGRHTVLVNLAEGDGALYHELTHVLMDADFPHAPLWLQEGMATLYEASELGGTIVDAADSTLETPRRVGTSAVEHCGPRLTPLPNWRAGILRRALREHRLPSIQQLIEAAAFRGPSEALDYAYARYLCLFLHRRAVLARYYVALREAERDATGGPTLLEVCAARDWAALDAEFRVWLSDLNSDSRTTESSQHEVLATCSARHDNGPFFQKS
jgi:hypothetical protein